MQRACRMTATTKHRMSEVFEQRSTQRGELLLEELRRIELGNNELGFTGSRKLERASGGQEDDREAVNRIQ